MVDRVSKVVKDVVCGQARVVPVPVLARPDQPAANAFIVIVVVTMVVTTTTTTSTTTDMTLHGAVHVVAAVVADHHARPRR